MKPNFLDRYREKLRKKHKKGIYERMKPYIELSLSVMTVILLALCVFYFFYFKNLYP